MAAQTFPTTGVRTGNYNWGEWKSIFDARLDEGYMQEEIRRYGLGSFFYDFVNMAGYETPVTTRTPKIFEILEWELVTKTGTQINTGAAGADISWTIHADDIDASGGTTIMENEAVVIPAAYQATGEDRIYVITDITGTTVTASPLSADGNTITESQISVAVPTSTVLKVHGSYWGPGTGMPDSHRSSRAVRTYYTTIVKTNVGFEGGIQAIKWRQLKSEGEANSAWIDGQGLAERFHSKKIDDSIFLGELNDNTALTQASNFGGTNLRRSTQGLWNWAEQAGQELLYPGTWDYTQLYDYKDLILSQNVVARDIMFMYGSDLGRMVEESGLDFLKEYSGGSDLMIATDKIGYNVKYHVANGFTFSFMELASFANPLRYGNKNYEFSKYGLMMPDQSETVTVEGRTERHSNLALGYLSGQGENRRRILSLQDGTTGRSAGVHEYDGSNLYILSEIVPLVFRPNQLVQVKPQ